MKKEHVFVFCLCCSISTVSSLRNVLNNWLTEDTQTFSVDTCLNKLPTDDVASSVIEDIYTAVNEGECSLASFADYPPHYQLQDGEQFDFIIVGAGSAGAVIANRLSEVLSWNILVIEAGGDPTKTTEIPAMFSSLQQTEVDWQYKTDSEEDNCLGMLNNRCNWPRGKVLGGSSSINANLYVRGAPKDFETWSEMGNNGWDYDTALWYFRKSENMKVEEILEKPDFKKYHGKRGYLSVDAWKEIGISDLVEGFSKGMEELGYENNDDYNGKAQLGFTKMQGTIVDGKRCSSAKAFLKSIKDRSNLKISKNSLATQLLIDRQSKTVVGVEVLNDQGDFIKIKANKEVIVSAGAINSPQLLMLSGIGPKKHLQEMKIKLVHDLPVGENLLDHALMTGLVFSHNYSREVKPMKEHMYDFLTKNSSKLSTIGMTSYCEFINTVNKSLGYPDIQLHHFDFDKGDHSSLQNLMKIFGTKDDIAKLYHKINSDRFINIVLPTLLSPKSKGKITLVSRNPLDSPKITSGYLTENEDIETFLRAIEFVESLAETEGMRKLDTKFHEITPSACEIHPAATREFRLCTLKHLVTSTYHPTSTCKMGPINDPSAVVDPSLRVIGVKSLRVADASIMPDIVRGNTNAATIMIGEKASDMIKQTWF